MKKILYTVGLAFTLSLGAMAQQTLNGVVKDASGKPFPGVKISKAGEFRINSITDESGVFSLELKEGDYIDLNYADVVLKRVKVTGETMNIVLDSHKDGMSDLGFMKRTEEKRTQSVSTIYADQLMKGDLNQQGEQCPLWSDTGVATLAERGLAYECRNEDTWRFRFSIGVGRRFPTRADEHDFGRD